MKYFIIRQVLNYFEVQISNGSEIYKNNLKHFLELEPSFKLQDNIKQIDYYPGLLYEIKFLDETLEILEADSLDLDKYISKVSFYIS